MPTPKSFARKLAQSQYSKSGYQPEASNCSDVKEFTAKNAKSTKELLNALSFRVVCAQFLLQRRECTPLSTASTLVPRISYVYPTYIPPLRPKDIGRI
jgi:hypothetical protein